MRSGRGFPQRGMRGWRQQLVHRVGVAALVTTLAVTSAVGVVVATATPAFAAALQWNVHATPVTNTSHSMSCAGGNFCMVVSTGGLYQTMVDRDWSEATPVPGAANLTGVSCTSDTDCVAVDSGGHAFTYASGTWSAPTLIDIKAGLAGVSCTSTSACMAVDGVGNALVLSGTTWSLLNIDPGHALKTVSCSSASFCVAGDNNGTEFTDNAGNWTFKQIASTRTLTALSCTGTSCVAGDSDGRGYLLSNGNWIPFFISASGSTVRSISCLTATFCLAADSFGGVEQYSGGFSITQPDYIGDQVAGLNGVGCLSTTVCVAIDSRGFAFYGHDGSDVPSTPRQVTAAVSGAGAIAVSFQPSPDDGNSGTLTSTANCASSDGGASGSASGTGSPLTVSGLTAGAHYTCAVTGSNNTGSGATSAPSNVALVGTPQPPTDVSAAPGYAQASVDFTPPADDGGSAVTSYTATCTSVDNVDTISSTAPAPPIVVGGLRNHMDYSCTVVATNAVGDSAPSHFATVRVQSVPAAPTITGITGGGSGKAYVHFTPGGDGGLPITGYTTTCTTLDHSQSSSASSTDTTVRVGSLVDGDTYTCVVHATNDLGDGADSAASDDLVVGGADVPVVTTTPGDGSISFAFGPPSDTGAAPVVSYDISCTSSDGGVEGPLTTVTSSPFEFDGLTNGKTYTCFVTADNGVGPGAPAIFGPYVLGTPGAPGQVLHFSPDFGEITVTFDLATDPGAAPITGYLATCQAGAGDGHVITKTGSSSPIQFTGVHGIDGDGYVCGVQAMNANGLGPIIWDTTNESIDLFSEPSAITNLVAKPNNQFVLLTMNRPGDDGGQFDGFDYDATCTSSTGGATATAGVYSTAASVSLTVTGLTNGKTYTCSVAGIFRGAQTPDAVTAPFVPAGPPIAPSSVTAGAGNASASLSWATAGNNGKPVTGYVVTPILNGTAQSSTLFLGTATSHVVTGLKNGKSYTFKVKANNAAGTSAQTTSGAVTVGAPAPPTGASASSNSTGTAVVTFTIGADNGTAITSQTATCTSSNGGATKTGMHSGATAAPITVAGLTVAKSYTCTVTATNANGTGLPSGATSAFVAIGPPAAPTGVVAKSGSTTTSTGSLSVSFTLGASNGSTITGQTATCTSSNGGVTKTGTHSGSTAATITISAVTTGKTYTCTVTASNGAGASAASAASLPVIVGSPAPPTGVTAARVASGQLKVTFTGGASNGSATMRYTATCTSSNGGTTMSKTGSASPITVTGLTAGKSYTCTVTATNSRGVGLASMASPAVTA